MMRYITLGLFILLSVVGCGARRHSGNTYSTVNEIARRDTDRAIARNQRAAELIRQGKLDEAETLLREALTADVMYGPAHNNLGRVYFEQSKFYFAAWEFEYATKLMPNQPEPRNNLGLVLETAQRLDDAVTYYRQALDIEPDNAEILGNLLRARLRRGDTDDDVPQMLRDLIMKDQRPDWVEWARERLARFPTASDRANP